MIDWVDALSRLHPVLLHMPIGLFVALAWLQLWARFAKDDSLGGGTRSALVTLLALTTFPAAASGWLLHEGSSYPDPVELHEQLGVALLVVALLVAWAHFKKPKLYPVFLWIGVLLMVPTAHLGGSLTHGEEFLIEPFMAASTPNSMMPMAQPMLQGELEKPTGQPVGASLPEPLPSKALTYEDIQPIFEDLCFRCHGERKQRGGLALNTLELALAGGDSGPALVLGDLEGSLLWKLMVLPLDHDDHMPPSKKSQPEPDELAEIKAWLSSPVPEQGEK
jgi:uncharacterized membrane protein